MNIRLLLYIVITACVLSGCTSNQEEKSAVAESKQPIISPEAKRKLANADKADGLEDHVIGKCYVCGLGMNGSEKFAVKLEDYKALLCSQACQREFEESADKLVMQTEIPAAKTRE